jgi:chorismate lyase/3-hydroxybenzoate synthase
MGGGMNRYMVFNAGRHDAMKEWLDGTSRFEQRVPTATGVGHRGRDLRIYCLAAGSPGEPIENPRQRPAYRYSERYGPLPPCFARAMLLDLDDTPTLLVGGTASVKGESTVHVGSVYEQLEETFGNLASLISRAAEEGAENSPREFVELRVYYVDPADADGIAARVSTRFPNLSRLEMVRADICRADLLVEIEGVARGV